MTTVAAVARDGVVWMAADTCTNVYERPIPDGARKILRVQAGDDEVLVGVCGDGGLVGLLAAGLTIGATPGQGDDPQPWAHATAKAVTELAVGAGLVENGRLDAHLLLGWRGRLWTMTHCMAIPHSDGLAALGSGEGPAIGALDALLNCGTEPMAAVAEAVRIGIRRDRYSGGEVQAEMLPAA